MIKKILLILFFLMCIWSGSVSGRSDISYEIDELEHSLGVDELESVDWVGVIIIAKMGCDVYLDTSPFDVNLSSADTNAQKAFETLDGLVAVSTATYSHTSSTATYAESVNYNVLVSSADYAPGDNLGNHTATQNLDLTGFGIINIGGLHGNSSLSIDSAGMLYLGPNNNSGLYWFSSVTGDALFGIGGVNESTFRLTKPLNLQASGNVNDYIQFKTASNIPEITTVGDCNLKITASGGTIDFDDENLITTGTGAVGSLSSSGQVTSNGNKLIDVYDWAVVITTPTWLGTDAVLVSPIRSFAVTITTITMITTGGTNFVGMIEQRAYASPHNAGTDIWTGDVTVSSTTWTTGTVSDYTVPANYGLYLVPTSVSGPVKILTLRGIVSKD